MSLVIYHIQFGTIQTNANYCEKNSFFHNANIVQTFNIYLQFSQWNREGSPVQVNNGVWTKIIFSILYFLCGFNVYKLDTPHEKSKKKIITDFAELQSVIFGDFRAR